MPNQPPLLPLARLYERTSAKGNTYFVGRLGHARVLLMKDTRAEEDNVWSLVLQDPGDRDKRPPPRRQQQAAPPDSQAPLPGNAPAPGTQSGTGQPFNDDLPI